jgi:hypothetical protein
MGRDDLGRPDAVRAVGVVVPAHNEEEHLGPCLASLLAATEHLVLPVRVVVVLDRCTDASARVVAPLIGPAGTRGASAVITVLEGQYSSVGVARAAGTRNIVEAFPGLPPEAVWTAHTDADTRVPPTWLHRQVDLAQAGHDVVIGSVEPDEPVGAPTYRLWLEGHPPGEGHSAIHGANLGVRMSSLLSVGNFRDLRLGEDVDAVGRLKASGARWTATDITRVVTSARREGRVPDGFSAYMREMDRRSDAGRNSVAKKVRKTE